MIQKRSKFLLVAVTVAFFVAPLLALGAVPQAGFPTRTIWFSKDPFFAGDQIFIFTAITKSGSDGLSGMVEFFDGSTSIGKTDFTISPDEGAKGISLSWKATAGNHSLSAQLAEASSIRNGVKTPLILAPVDSRTETITTIVDTDTNKNGIADTIDQKNKIEQAAKLAGATSVGIGDTFTKLETKAGEYVPDAVAKKAAEAGSFLEGARDGLATVIQNEQVSARDRITVIKARAGTTGAGGIGPYDRAEKPFRYVELFALWVVAFVAGHPIIYYVILFYIAYHIVRAMVRMFRRKRREY